MLKKTSGFTLIELMIVVAIVVFLATIAIPRYGTYFAKARQVEVAMILGSLHTAQVAYHATHGSYTTNIGGNDGLGWKPEGYGGGGKAERFHYSYGSFFPGAREGVHFFTGSLQTPSHHLGQGSALKDEFVLVAAAEHGADNFEVWQIDQSRNLKRIK